jgi:DNA-binding beta-propeller fold protein YncE
MALVTAETQNQLIAVGLPGGRVLRRLAMPADPQNVEVAQEQAVVVSTRGGAVTLVDTRRLRVRKIFPGFASPHIAAVSPDQRWAYVTDDGRGQLAVISLTRDRLVRKVFVGSGAHHLSFSPDQQTVWIALSERARTIVVVDTSRPARPRVISRIDPRGLAHDLAFAPGGRQVWVTYDDRSEIAILDARTGRRVRTLPAGSPPQHVAFDPFSRARHAYVTSGKDGTLRIVSLRTGRVVRQVRIPYGSFNLGLSGGLVATSSLYGGTLTELDGRGRTLLAKRIATSARDVAIAVVP